MENKDRNWVLFLVILLVGGNCVRSHSIAQLRKRVEVLEQAETCTCAEVPRERVW